MYSASKNCLLLLLLSSLSACSSTNRNSIPSLADDATAKNARLSDYRDKLAADVRTEKRRCSERYGNKMENAVDLAECQNKAEEIYYPMLSVEQRELWALRGLKHVVIAEKFQKAQITAAEANAEEAQLTADMRAEMERRRLARARVEAEEIAAMELGSIASRR